jgi:arginase family enzyme
MVVVMFDAVFTVQFVVNLLAQPWQKPPLEDDTIKECDEDDVENDLPKDLGQNVGRVKGDGKDFIPERKAFFVRLGGECDYVHSLSIALLRMIVNN